jgi:hypothetical protein
LSRWVRCSSGPSSSFAPEIATRLGLIAVQVLAVTRQACWIGGGKRAPRVRAHIRAFTGVGPDVRLHVGLLEGLVIAIREWACVHTD